MAKFDEHLTNTFKIIDTKKKGRCSDTCCYWGMATEPAPGRRAGEGGGFNPANFCVGVIDFFAIILPGAILVFLASCTPFSRIKLCTQLRI